MTIADTTTVSVENVSKWFGQKVAVSEITSAFGPGVTGLLGPNGAGKTTLLRMMTGLVRPSEGRITIEGINPHDDYRALNAVGFVAEDEAVYKHLTARKFVRFNAVLAGAADPDGDTEQAIELVDLQGAADRPVGGFSKGMRQRTKVAAALVHRPRVLLLDEPLNGADPVQRSHLIDLFKTLGTRGYTVIVSSHVLPEVERMADRIIAITDGRLAASGDVRSLRALMTDIPQTIRIDADKPRILAAALISTPYASGVKLEKDTIHVEAADPAGLARAIARLAKQHDVIVSRIQPEDESLESVFSYLVHRR